jgi:hypothetical protein
MRKDLVYVTLGSALPAISNFVAVVFALRYIDAAWLGRSYALLALFFVSIDVFNFGSARLYSVAKIRERFPSLLFLDTLSAAGSTLFFTAAAIVLSRSGSIAMPHLLPVLVIAPVGYAMSHFALGYLRLNGGNGAICAVSTVSALSRCAVVWLVAAHASWSSYLPDLLLLVEGSYGAMLLGTYLVLRRPGKVSQDRSSRLAAFPQLAKLGGKELVSSWYSNAIFSGAKHADVIIASMLLGPAGAALYRGAKSVHNVAFNLGQALALVVHSRMRAWFSCIDETPVCFIGFRARRGDVCLACGSDPLRLQNEVIPHSEPRSTLDSISVSLADLHGCRAYVRLPDHLSHGVLDQQTIIPHPLDHGGRRLSLATLCIVCGLWSGGCRAIRRCVVWVCAGFVTDGREAIIQHSCHTLNHPSSRARAAIAMRAIVSVLNRCATL